MKTWYFSNISYVSKRKRDSSTSHRGTAAAFQDRFLSARTLQNVVKVRVSDFRESGTRRPQSGPAPDAVSFRSVKQYEQVIPRSVKEYALCHSQSHIYDLCIKPLTPIVTALTAFPCLQL